ncbi:MAG: hypothetical protein PUI09_06790 [bacterium]|nr:hypothetical protein [bacterium]MDY2650078.1 hypothetical protein [Candidatus Egerieousia sp.]
MAEHLLARGTVAENHREAFAGQGAAAELHREAATAGKGRYCWKGEQLPERRTTAGKESHCQKGKVRSATAGKKGLQRSNGLVSFFDAPLMQIIPIFVVW